MKRKVKWGIAGSLLLILLAALYLFLCLIFSESEHPERGTPAWHILFAGTIIKDVPLTDIRDEPQYYYTAGDGPKLHEVSVSFLSPRPVGALRAEIDQYILSKGYVRSEESYRKGESKVEFTIEPYDGSTETSLVNISEFP